MFNAQQFAARLADRQDRWSLLKDFVAEWHTPLQEGDGYTAEEVDAAEQRLGLKLPVALREWYQLAGQREDIIATQNALLHPASLNVRNGLLVFHVENQWVVQWGIQTADMHMVDPPVWLDNSGLHTTQQKPIRENDTLSEFALQMVVLETTITPKLSQGYSKISPQALKQVEKQFIHLGFPDWPWPVYLTRFYGGDDVLVLMFGDEEGALDGSLHVTAPSRAAFDQVGAILEITWEHYPFD